LEFLRVVIADRSGQKTPRAHSELLHELESKWGVVLLTDPLRHRLPRIPGRKIVIGVSEEAYHVIYGEQQIDDYCNMFESMTNGVREAITHNADAVGFESWIDVNSMAVAEPTDYAGTEIAVPVGRNDSRALMIVWSAPSNSRRNG
jgi:hypothetical protein